MTSGRPGSTQARFGFGKAYSKMQVPSRLASLACQITGPHCRNVRDRFQVAGPGDLNALPAAAPPNRVRPGPRPSLALISVIPAGPFDGPDRSKFRPGNRRLAAAANRQAFDRAVALRPGEPRDPGATIGKNCSKTAVFPSFRRRYPRFGCFAAVQGGLQVFGAWVEADGTTVGASADKTMLGGHLRRLASVQRRRIPPDDDGEEHTALCVPAAFT
jgi:hypothetical protein